MKMKVSGLNSNGERVYSIICGSPPPSCYSTYPGNIISRKSIEHALNGIKELTFWNNTDQGNHYWRTVRSNLNKILTEMELADIEFNYYNKTSN